MKLDLAETGTSPSGANPWRIGRRTLLLGALLAGCSANAQAPARTATLADLRRTPRLTLSEGREIEVQETGTGGMFRWDSRSDAPEDGGTVIMLADQGRGRWLRVFTGALNAKWFGASPNATAVVNSNAFAAASAAIARAGGGTLLVPPGEYRVGAQLRRQPVPIIHVEGCRRAVSILGRGAVLKAADGLKFGSFHPVTGRRFDPPKMPHYDPAYRIDGYHMIFVKNCAGPVRIEGFELDGNLGRYDLGGLWGDTGRQVNAYGIMLENNTGGVTVVGVNSHHHGCDGILIAHYGLKPSEPRYSIQLIDVTCDSNARQGLSWIGGNELTALRCRFTRTGRARFDSGPSAGVDVEATNSICRNGHFIECSFVDNAGVGFLTDYGDTENIRLERCTFVGTTTWAVWPRKPRIVFADCTIAGSVVHAHPDADPNRAARFERCRFTDDPSLSPTGQVHGEEVANFGGATNVLASDCAFEATTAKGTLPFSPSDVRYHSCRFRQRGTKQSYPRGVYTGTNTLESAGPVELAGSRYLGRVVLNGRALS